MSAPSCATPSRDVGIAHRRGDVRAERVGELDRGGPDPAGGAVDEQPLAGPQLTLREERVVGGREDLRQPAGVRKGDRIGHGHELALVDGRELGLPAAADDAHHAIAFGEAPRARPERLDRTRKLQARNVLRASCWSRVAPAQLHHVGAVQAGSRDSHEHLAGARLGVGMLLDEDLAVPDRGGTHRLRV